MFSFLKASSRSIQSKTTKTKLNEACEIALAGVSTILDIAGALTDLGAPVPPGVKPAIECLKWLIATVEKTNQNSEQAEVFISRIIKLVKLLSKYHRNDPLLKGSQDPIVQLLESLGLATKKVDKIRSRSKIKRVIMSSKIEDDLKDSMDAIARAIEDFQTEALLEIRQGVEETRQGVGKAREEIRQAVTDIETRIEQGNSMLFAYDCDRREPCIDGTRTEILATIKLWLGTPDAGSEPQGEHRAEMDAPMMWITGEAGTGKTALAFTLAKYCDDRRILGANFFCSRDHAECRDSKMVFHSIAKMLARFYPKFATHHATALRENPDARFASEASQMEKLIVNPLQAAGPLPPCIVVIDALDECERKGATSVVLRILARFLEELRPLRFLITSRPEPTIGRLFKHGKLESSSNRLNLREEQIPTIDRDIAIYLRATLEDVRAQLGVDEGWPSETEIEDLVKLSDGLFIFAATVVKSIQNSRRGNPQARLTHMLKMSHPGSNALDLLYCQVLTDAFPEDEPGLVESVRDILGAIVVMEDPMGLRSLRDLLYNQEATTMEIGIRGTLEWLQSVILLPKDDESVIRLLHKSFADFLVDSSRCKPTQFLIECEYHHTRLARACLRALLDLKGEPSDAPILEYEGEDASALTRAEIASNVRYACRHWTTHLAKATLSVGLFELLHSVCRTTLLRWVEVCGVLDVLRPVSLGLTEVVKTVKGSNIPYEGRSEVTSLLYDCSRLMAEFSSLIISSPSEVHRSALWFTPSQTLLKKTYVSRLPFPLKGVPETWGSCFRTITVGSVVNSASLSWNGALIVTAADWSNVQVRDGLMGVLQHTFGSFGTLVGAVAISGEGKRVAIGFGDGTVQLRDLPSGALERTLEGHELQVLSVDFSPNGNTVVSGSKDWTVRVWNISDGMQVAMFEGHLYSVNSVQFSPDGKWIISASDDKTVKLWDVADADGTEKTEFVGHTSWVNSATFSPNGNQIVSGSTDRTARVWDVASGRCITTLECDSSIQSVAFSRCGKKVVCGLLTGEVKVLDVASGSGVMAFRGHTRHVTSVRMSKDGSTIVSSSGDGTVRIWDGEDSERRGEDLVMWPEVISADGDYALLTDGETKVLGFIAKSPLVGASGTDFGPPCLAAYKEMGAVGFINGDVLLLDGENGQLIQTFIGHTGGVQSMEFSADGSRLATASYDKTARVWDVANRECIVTLEGHTDSLLSLALTKDGSRIATGSVDKTMRLWSTSSGTQLMVFEGHPSFTISLAFSPDECQIASGSEDKVVRLWDVSTGACIHTFTGHTNPVHSIAFVDSRWVVTLSHDEAIVWNAVTREHIRTIKRCIVGQVNATLRDCIYSLDQGWIVRHRLSDPTSQQRLFWMPPRFLSQVKMSSGKLVGSGPVFIDLSRIDGNG